MSEERKEGRPPHLPPGPGVPVRRVRREDEGGQIAVEKPERPAKDLPRVKAPTVVRHG